MLIAQLSDIHAAPDNDNLARLHNAIDWLLALQPDLLVVSGDLTDDGWHEAIWRLPQNCNGCTAAHTLSPAMPTIKR